MIILIKFRWQHVSFKERVALVLKLFNSFCLYFTNNLILSINI